MPETVYPVLLKDESGRAISPIVRTSTIYNGAGNPIGDFVSESELSDQFDTTKAYAKGDYCIKDNTVYKFTAAKSAGAWDSTKVLETKIADEVSLINSNLTQLRPDGIGVVSSLTTSAKEGTLIDDAFSNYDMIIIVADDTGDARRASMVLPMASFVASSNNILTFLAGGQTFTMSVKYKTDTKFEAYLSASTSGLGITMQCKVYGMMKR